MLFARDILAAHLRVILLVLGNRLVSYQHIAQWEIEEVDVHRPVAFNRMVTHTIPLTAWITMVVVTRTRTDVSVSVSLVCDRHWALLATGYPTGGRGGAYGTGGYGTGFVTTNVVAGRPIATGGPLGYGGSGALGMGGYGPLGGGLPPKIRAIFIPQGGGMMGGNQW